MNTELRSAQTRPFVPAFVRGGAAGIVVASIVNAALFVATSPFAFPADALIAGAGVPVNLTGVIMSTVIGGGLGLGGYALMRRFLSTSWRTSGVLYGLAVLVLLLTAYGPFTIQNVGAAQIVVMQLMHVVAGIVPLYNIIRSERL